MVIQYEKTKKEKRSHEKPRICQSDALLGHDLSTVWHWINGLENQYKYIIFIKWRTDVLCISSTQGSYNSFTARIKGNTTPYNDSPYWIDPVMHIVGEKGCYEANDIGDNVKEVILSISFDNLIRERAAVNNQHKLDQCNWQHYADQPPFLLLCQAEVNILNRKVNRVKIQHRKTYNFQQYHLLGPRNHTGIIHLFGDRQLMWQTINLKGNKSSLPHWIILKVQLLPHKMWVG